MPMLKVINGDCLEALANLPAECVDSIVCDPPYGIGFLGKDWDSAVPGEEWARLCLRVLKPGGHLIAFASTRTVHRLAVSLEDAGFEIRDQIGWVYYNGFPKNHDVAAGIDKQAGVKRRVVGHHATDMGGLGGERLGEAGGVVTAATSPAAQKWDGWGTALKPAVEPAVLARKPLSGTVAQTVIKYGTGALNIEGCRFRYGDRIWIGPQQEIISKVGEVRSVNGTNSHGLGAVLKGQVVTIPPSDIGRWPANLVHFPKPSTAERQRGWTTNTHPTVKPVGVMRWLQKLVTPPGGVTLDPFMGSGAGGVAAVLEGLGYIGVELDTEYYKIAQSRIRHAQEYPEQWLGGSTDRQEAEENGQISLFDAPL